MRHLLFLLLFGFTVLSLAADPPAKDAKDAKDPKDTKESSPQPIVVGKDLPGAFHPLNVTGPRKGNYHCLVSDYGLNPNVLIFSRDLDFGNELKSLLKQLDN